MSDQGAPTPPEIPILIRGDRGFHGYGEPMADSYGSVLEVYESSNADGPHVWLNINVNAWDHNPDKGEATAHLNEEQARALMARLQAWLDEIPARWGRA